MWNLCNMLKYLQNFGDTYKVVFDIYVLIKQFD